jgi:virginiamycin B lyase
MTRSTRHRPARARRRPTDRVRARPRLEGLEDRCLLSPTITEFPVPPGNEYPFEIRAGADGNLWFTEGFANNIGMINPATHAITEFPIPTANESQSGITAGPDGNLWFTEYSSTGKPIYSASNIGMITTDPTHTIYQFATPTANSGPRAIAAGPDGNLWFTEVGADKIGMINPATHAITEFAIPTASAYPQGICAGPDGNVWFTEETSKIGMINLATYVITEVAVPSGGTGTITAGPDGNLWFTEVGADKIGMINPTDPTHHVTEFTVPTAGAGPAWITAGADGNLWFTEQNVGQIGMINPATHAITEYPIPYANTRPYGITAGPDSNVWFADHGTNSIGVVTLTPNADHFVVTQQSPSSVTAGSPFGLTVQADDSSGNLDSSFNGTVTVALANNPGGTTLGGTLSVTASGGVATFSGLTLTKAASGYTLLVSAGGVDSVTTNVITVTAATAAQLVVTQQPPATVKVSSPFALKASIEDAYGNVVTTASGTVSAAFANNPTGATLGGALTVTASQGVASFTNLTINKTGSGYTLLVSSSGLASATSNPINVTKNGMASSTLSAPTGSLSTDLSLAPLVLDSPDLWDGLGFKRHSRRA